MIGGPQMDDHAAGFDRRYFLNSAERWVLAPTFAVVFFAIGVSWARSSYAFDRSVGIVVVLLGLGLASWAMFYVRLELKRDSIAIYNVRRKTIRYEDISEIDLPYEGLRVRAHGRSYVVLAVQKWNIARMLRKRTRADEIADQIRSRCEATRRY